MTIAAKCIPSNGELPSGKSVKDLIKHVLDKMRLVDYKDKHKNNLIPPTVFPARPDTWVFPGYVAFAYFACPILVPSSEQLDVFTENGKGLDKQTNKESGRRYQRQKAAGKVIETGKMNHLCRTEFDVTKISLLFSVRMITT